MFVYDTDVEQKAFMIGTLGVAPPEGLFAWCRERAP